MLGHKEFHTAGMHLAQMLYIWPYFFFFSWPLLVIPVLNIIVPRSVLPKYLNYGFPEKQKKLPGLVAALVVLPTMLAIVHFNTIVHPFTLADNRHYVFYVFRLLLGVHPAVKYAAVFVYFLCGWAVISAFGFSIVQAPPQLLRVPPSKSTARATPATPATPAAEPAAAEEPQGNRKERRAKAKENKTTSKKESTSKKEATSKKNKPTQSDPQSPEALAKVQEHLTQRQSQQPNAPRVSFVLVWLAATALSLVTAPLVEPRYFIIPWVIWRLHLPSSATPAIFRQKRPLEESEKAHADMITNAPKFLETIWFIIINAVTGYLFLYKGFEWPQEPGKTQRFMW